MQGNKVIETNIATCVLIKSLTNSLLGSEDEDRLIELQNFAHQKTFLPNTTRAHFIKEFQGHHHDRWKFLVS